MDDTDILGAAALWPRSRSATVSFMHIDSLRNLEVHFYGFEKFMTSYKLRTATFIEKRKLSNFVINKNLLAFLYGLDRYYENLIVDDHEFRVAQFPVVGVGKTTQKMTVNKPFHRIIIIGP